MKKIFYDYESTLQKIRLFDAEWVNDKIWSQSIVIFDLEHTGGHPDQASVIEIAALKFESGRFVRAFHHYVKPIHSISPIVRKMTGLLEKDLAESPSWLEVYEMFWEFASDSWLISHGILGDRPFLQNGGEQTGLFLRGPALCTQTLASALFPQALKTSLQSFVQHFHLSLPSHHAMSDAVATALLFEYLIHKKIDDDRRKLTEYDFLSLMIPKNLQNRLKDVVDIQSGRVLDLQEILTFPSSFVTLFSEQRELLGRFYWSPFWIQILNLIADVSHKQAPLPKYIQKQTHYVSSIQSLVEWHLSQSIYPGSYAHYQSLNPYPFFLQIDLKGRRFAIRAGLLRETYGWVYLIKPGVSFQKVIWSYHQVLKLLNRSFEKEDSHECIAQLMIAREYFSAKQVMDFWPHLKVSEIFSILDASGISLLPLGTVTVEEPASKNRQVFILEHGLLKLANQHSQNDLTICWEMLWKKRQFPKDQCSWIQTFLRLFKASDKKYTLFYKPFDCPVSVLSGFFLRSPNLNRNR